MSERNSIIVAIAVAGFAASCTPYPEQPPPQPQPPTKKGQEGQTVSSEEQQRLQEERKKAAEEAKRKLDEEGAGSGNEAGAGGGGTANGGGGGTSGGSQSWEFARPVPGKEGFVFSPYNNKVIDVREIPSGTLVQDPTYPAAEKKYFRVP